jgi:hypothetical protein
MRQSQKHTFHLSDRAIMLRQLCSSATRLASKAERPLRCSV